MPPAHSNVVPICQYEFQGMGKELYNCNKECTGPLISASRDSLKGTAEVRKSRIRFTLFISVRTKGDMVQAIKSRRLIVSAWLLKQKEICITVSHIIQKKKKKISFGFKVHLSILSYDLAFENKEFLCSVFSFFSPSGNVIIL